MIIHRIPISISDSGADPGSGPDSGFRILGSPVPPFRFRMGVPGERKSALYFGCRILESGFERVDGEEMSNLVWRHFEKRRIKTAVVE